MYVADTISFFVVYDWYILKVQILAGLVSVNGFPIDQQY